MTEKTENFIRRLRWRAYHFCQSNSQPVNESANGYFGFKTLTTPPPKEHLNAFENDLCDLIQKVDSQMFRTPSNKNSGKMSKVSSHQIIC